MKIKRIAFIGSLIVLFAVCFAIMNEHYDELARYPYVTSENREVILKHLNNEDINYMIAQQLKPEQFLPFIETKGFQIRNTLWYNRAKEMQDARNEVIVAFINDYRKKLDYASLETLLQAYSYDTLRIFFSEDNDYIKNASIITNPAAALALIDENETLFTYQPNDLVAVDKIATVPLHENKKNTIYLRKETIQPLHDLCDAISAVNNKTCGNLILTSGYLSYEDQIPMYESMMLKYGKDKFQEYWDYPGQSEYQLGTMVRFQPAGKEVSHIDEFGLENEKAEQKENDEQEEPKETQEQKLAKWLSENAYKYGFVVRYPQGKEDVSGKAYQPFTLRYVGLEHAKALYENHQVLEEYTLKTK